jgi:hypothetical protein
MPRTVKRAWLLGVVCLVFLGLAVALSSRSKRDHLAGAEMLAVFNCLETGMTKADFRRCYDQQSVRILRVLSVSEDTSLIMTPLQWGAINWVMWVKFTDEEISSISIRLHDDPEKKPAGAPGDKEAR